MPAARGTRAPPVAALVLMILPPMIFDPLSAPPTTHSTPSVCVLLRDSSMIAASTSTWGLYVSISSTMRLISLMSSGGALMSSEFEGA